MNPRFFYEFTLYYDFCDFLENDHFNGGYFHENFWKSYKSYLKGEFIKIEKFTLVIIFAIFSEKWQFRPIIKVFKFLGIEPNIRMIETTGGLEEVGKWSSNMSL